MAPVAALSLVGLCQFTVLGLGLTEVLCTLRKRLTTTELRVFGLCLCLCCVLLWIAEGGMQQQGKVAWKLDSEPVRGIEPPVLTVVMARFCSIGHISGSKELIVGRGRKSRETCCQWKSSGVEGPRIPNNRNSCREGVVHCTTAQKSLSGISGRARREAAVVEIVSPVRRRIRNMKSEFPWNRSDGSRRILGARK
ncbi:hypothetical protein V8F20_000754 [Naviculisporaceae sp. PSN 640]